MVHGSAVAIVVVTVGACGLSSESLELRVKSERVHPSYDDDRHGVAPPRSPDIEAICVLQIRLPHHVIDGILGDSHQMPPASKNMMMTIADASQVGTFCHGKGRFDLLFSERRMPLLQPLMLDGSGATETVDGSSLCSYVECLSGVVS